MTHLPFHSEVFQEIKKKIEEVNVPESSLSTFVHVPLSGVFVSCHDFHRAVELILNRRVAYITISMDDRVLMHTA